MSDSDLSSGTNTLRRLLAHRDRSQPFIVSLVPPGGSRASLQPRMLTAEEIDRLRETKRAISDYVAHLLREQTTRVEDKGDM